MNATGVTKNSKNDSTEVKVSPRSSPSSFFEPAIAGAMAVTAKTADDAKPVMKRRLVLFTPILYDRMVSEDTHGYPNVGI